MKTLKTALINIRRSPYQSLLVLLMMSLTFIIGYLVAFAIYASNTFLQEIESQPQIVAFFKLDTPKETLESVKNQLDQLSYTKTVTLITQEEALKLYKEENQDEPLLLELVTADILPASIEVSTYKIDDLKKVKEVLEKVEAIDEVVYQQDVINTVAQTIHSIKTTGLVVVAVLAFLSFLTMVVIIALKVAGKKHAINIMRLVGADRGFIRRPYVLEGAIYGFGGSVIGFGVASTLTYFAWPKLMQLVKLSFTLPFTSSLLMIYLASGSLAGILLGGFAGLVAANRLIKH